uniref:Uncharacterized protein n=1 Tax=Corethron hystrix TaxID=216773 RepID=A0A7S1FN19_9STRA|mmetsp:Transcript_17358/g.39185  ORF Transcript_17358/g.39185 Transcript_17358/m.39185 type:complete len:323 (+) Transcript_17358:1090-2058(+)
MRGDGLRMQGLEQDEGAEEDRADQAHVTEDQTYGHRIVAGNSDENGASEVRRQNLDGGTRRNLCSEHVLHTYRGTIDAVTRRREKTEYVAENQRARQNIVLRGRVGRASPGIARHVGVGIGQTRHDAAEHGQSDAARGAPAENLVAVSETDQKGEDAPRGTDDSGARDAGPRQALVVKIVRAEPERADAEGHLHRLEVAVSESFRRDDRRFVVGPGRRCRRRRVQKRAFVQTRLDAGSGDLSARNGIGLLVRLRHGFAAVRILAVLLRDRQQRMAVASRMAAAPREGGAERRTYRQVDYEQRVAQKRLRGEKTRRGRRRKTR